jgi:lipid-A-disaccharide synthase
MVRKSFMLIAGETSGDLLAAELVRVLHKRLPELEAVPSPDAQPLHASLEPRFFGAGGAQMAEAGVTLAFDMTRYAVVGLWEVIKKYHQFRRLFHQLLNLAIEREPDAIICVDFSGFNLRFGRAVRKYCRSLGGTFANWNPRLIQYVSPQVWASRAERARILERDFDLVLSIFPFEKEWYARHAPKLHVEFIGHPLIDRYATVQRLTGPLPKEAPGSRPFQILLLPGSRVGELQRHLPVMLEALARIRSAKPGLRARIVLPNERLVEMSRMFPLPADLEVQGGGLAEALANADLALASTGTVTLECALFGLPTVALYKTSWSTYWVGKQLVQVRFLAMPNILADEEVFPEFIQHQATSENIAGAALDLIDKPERRLAVKAKLSKVVQSLGPSGATERAAQAILELIGAQPRPIRAALNAPAH